ncbi:hypothetical protein [Herbiconiux sp. L3-i23]|uniref:RCC1 domain-containing protein n=1 Tax=Herbiconiux sp. L3-i23 TaxID=2905871 RepID=UPI002065EFBB|nr:hypothetical protein [Herbiconiux sp. L3-i23]BDI23885.1 hypothetical protein L3i23_26610 [Herbiconiux sp. L3-i23]
MTPTSTKRRRALAASILVLATAFAGVSTSLSGAWFTASTTARASVSGALLTIGEIGKTSDQTSIAVSGVYPMTDEQAASTSTHGASARSEWITVRNTGTIGLDWELQIVDPRATLKITQQQLSNFRFRLYDEQRAPLTDVLTLGSRPATAIPDGALTKGRGLAAGGQSKIEIRMWLSTDSENQFQESAASFLVFINAIQNGSGGMPSTALSLTANRAGVPSGTTTDLRWTDVAPALRAAGITGTPTYTVERSASADFSNPQTVYSGTGAAAADSGEVARSTPATGRYVDVSTDGFQGCVVTAQGAVYCSGQGYPGDGGAYSTDTKTTITQVTGGLQNKRAVKVDAALGHSCALTDAGELYCWGDYPGNGTTKSLLPVLANAGVLLGKKVSQFGVISGGGTCAMATDGTIGCWGYGNVTGRYPQSSAIGWGGGSTTAVGMNLGSLQGKTVSQLSVGGTHTCALATDNTVHCWGINMMGELGASTAPMVEAFNPIRALTPALNGATIRKLTSGSQSSCILTSKSDIWCWGWMGAPWAPSEVTWKDMGQTMTKMSSVSGATDIVATTAGLCALANAKAYCWGGDYQGIVGDGGDTNKLYNTPTPVAGVAATASIASIRLNSSSAFPGACVITTDGRVACWGAAGYTGAAMTAQLGTSNTAPMEFIRSLDGTTVCATGSVELASGKCSLQENGTYYYRLSYTVAGVPGWVSPVVTASR